MKETLIEKFLQNPSYIYTGAGKLANQWGCSKDEVYEARDAAKDILASKEKVILQEKIASQDELISKLTEEKINRDTGESSITIQSNQPLTPEEIDQLANVDNITRKVSTTWLKSHKNGIWTYSISTKLVADFVLSTTGLADKIREIFPDQTPFSLPVVNEPTEQALIILVSDDHAGIVNTTDNFDSIKISYKERLMKVSEEVKRLGKTFEEVHIISLGDQLNGWNSQTTRGGHEVKSLSNEQQFDIYTSARVDFYNDIFSSGISNSYHVRDMENSNHSGLGMSYMANRMLETYLSLKFPQVKRQSSFDMIDSFEYGSHVIMFGHGKDEKFQTRPMPAVLNDRTDLYLYHYAGNKGYYPYDKTITFYKGDLHLHGVQYGKFGRYVNVQSVAGNTDYCDANFGRTRAGAHLEILDKNSYRIVSQPIWF